jgi:4-diphosphocytidyl-2-C-methyl-D-erythritol kinase
VSARRRVRVHAPAKINPWLAVLGRRADGFHEIDAGFLALELGDELVLEETDGSSVDCVVDGEHGGPEVPRDARNLAVQALHRARERAAKHGLAASEAGLKLRLTKNVPAGAGLGGGSSDAAAAIFAFEQLFEIDLGEDWRRTVLSALGSDCVFFDIARNTGFGQGKGRGEVVEAHPPPSPRWQVIVIAPSAPASTSAVYSALGMSLSDVHPPFNFPVSALDGPVFQTRSKLFNQLESVAFSVVPELRIWRSALDSAGAGHFRLSGSGSSFFGIHEDAEAARSELDAIVRELEARGLPWRGVWNTRPAGRTFRTMELDSV